MKKPVVKIALGLAGLLLLAVAVMWLAGMLFVSGHSFRLKPVSIWTWYQYWYWYRDDAVQRAHLYRALMQAVLMIALVGIVILFITTRRSPSLYGDARFANGAEVRKSGLFASHGIIVGSYGGKYLRFAGQQFVLVAAPTRSGKGVGIVIPNLLSFSDSVVVLDIKQENFNLTAGYRAKHGQPVFLFNPFAADGRTHRYNPLTYVSDEPHLRIRDILTIGTILFPTEGKDGSGKDAFWAESARNLFLGLTLLVCESPELPRTLGEVMRQASGYGRKLAQHLNAVIQGRWAEGRPLSAICVDALYRVLDNSEITFASIVSTFNAALINWANPIFDAATSESDFLLTDVRRKRMSIYVGITPDHLPEASSILNIFFSQLINLNVRELPQANPELRHQCLLVMDEFTSMGKINILAKAVGFMAGYNLRLLPIIQSTSQLTATYGAEDARTFITNHALQVIFTPREQRDAEDYSRMLGDKTIRRASQNRPSGFGLQKGAPASDTISEQRRSLMLPQELKELGVNQEIIFLENSKPVLATKIRYYADRRFRSLVCPPPPIAAMEMGAYLSRVEQSRAEMAKYVPQDPAANPGGGADGTDIASNHVQSLPEQSQTR